MRKIWLITSIVVSIIAFSSIFLWQLNQTPPTEKAPLPFVTSVVSPTTVTSPPSPVPKEKANITVTNLKANDTVYLPITIKGEARVFENQFNFRVRDSDGTVLTEGTGYANAPDAGLFGSFIITIKSIAEPNGTRGTIEVFDYSAKDGTEIDKVSIPVQFNKEKNTTLRIYFGSNQQPGGLVCENVTQVLRSVAKTQSPARVAIEELLKGPTEAEKLHGYFTSINSGVTIQKLTVTDGVARIDFDKKLEEQVGGSCRVTAISAQITQTLKQFPTIKDIIISIDGRTEDILQP